MLVCAGMLVACPDDSNPSSAGDGVGAGDPDAVSGDDDVPGDGSGAGDRPAGDPLATGDASAGDTVAPGDGAGAPVGALCANDHDCRSGLCWLTIPGGYCTVDCDGGFDCPAGSVPARVYVGGGTHCRCMRSCVTKDDCSYRDFECHSLGYNDEGVCSQPF